MFCYGCNKKFYVKRDFYSLFSLKKYYLCDKCYQENKIDPMVEKLDCRKEVIIINLLKRRPSFNYDVYFNELSIIMKRYIFNNEYFVVFLEELYLSLTMIRFIDWLSEVNEKKLLIITFLKLN